MFRKLVTTYREFALDGRRAEEVVHELLYLSEHLGILDAPLERALMKAFRTENMVDVELAKELFHTRLKGIDPALLGGVDPVTLFEAEHQLRARAVESTQAISASLADTRPSEVVATAEQAKDIAARWSGDD